MEAKKINNLIELYAKQTREKLNQNLFKRTSQLNDFEWAASELAKTEKQMKILNPIVITLVIIMVVVVLCNQFELIHRTNGNALVTFCLCTVGLYLQIERNKVKTERLKTMLFLNKIKNGLSE